MVKFVFDNMPFPCGAVERGHGEKSPDRTGSAALYVRAPARISPCQLSPVPAPASVIIEYIGQCANLNVAQYFSKKAHLSENVRNTLTTSSLTAPSHLIRRSDSER